MQPAASLEELAGAARLLLHWSRRDMMAVTQVLADLPEGEAKGVLVAMMVLNDSNAGPGMLQEIITRAALAA